MGNTASLEEYENRIKKLEQRVFELEQKVFLKLDDSVIYNRAFNPRQEMFVNPSNKDKIILNDFIEDLDNESL